MTKIININQLKQQKIMKKEQMKIIREVNEKTKQNDKFCVMDKEISITYDLRTWLQISRSINDLLNLITASNENDLISDENLFSIYSITDLNSVIHSKTFDVIEENDNKIFNQPIRKKA